ncbi:trafficking kinesin-binding protein 2 isoform X1 [Centrocercus urophasianus]|uniref:trafficking kinesin-binding protein 2 isoform X1 n=1 Tax=Centrocercus urophasianus TaxID=9002 RepID=UPI001C650759|nr:trafficking kinesin-binding protein 2 isoform X1 [Centrocercus urophasianus]XP_042677842.1 trafficking kinesin-binding protein 2 isoform X1 [Centrocercus urophasianus]XP_042677843.1 trafficking kinesin-binding protein 2 isoform X1 [Centrocercus urophasianus]XP_042677844.1 trafficking kinesin-binding protein 2 isoform X1 [Centrocercus urophasianus]
MNFDHRILESISDVCSTEDLPEVELVSMLEEQLPDYKLRVDSLYLYENHDWIQSPTHRGHLPEISSPVHDEETFRYMILGTDNMEQKTYSDADMVRHLLAEKDRDLELAARIGQALLKRNHLLTEQNEALEEQLGQTLDQVNQLQHELSKKDDLLRIVSIASEESETDSSCSTPLRFNESFSVSQGLLQLDILQDKLRELEEENLALRSKACHLKTETITYEEKEQQLVNDCVRELRQTNAQISRITEELSEKSEELVRYQEEISSLLFQIVDLQHKLKEHVIEKEELKLHLQASKDAQRQLTAELHELQDRNAECLGMLHESQEEVKLLRSRASSVACLCHPQDSLAAEIEGTMRKELSQVDESLLSKQKSQQKRVFDTVRVANVTRSRSSSFPAPLPIPGSNRSSVVMTAKPFQSGLQMESHAQMIQRSSSEKNLKGRHKPGQPGTPGDSDLVTALHRLSLRHQNYLSEKQFFEEEWERKMHLLNEQKEGASGYSTPTESCFSLGTNSEFTDLSASSSNLRVLLPEKLQIVKPIEGSQTLFHWQQLARPNLGTILDPRPGVVTKGFTPLTDDSVHRISDLEEDDEEGEGGITFQVQQSFPEKNKSAVAKPVSGIFLSPIASVAVPLTALNPGKCLSSTNSTFTFTTCRILHPSDVTQVTPSSTSAPLSLGNSGKSFGNHVVSTPAMSYRLSIGEFLTNRGDSTTTLSSTSSLAQLLQERGISAKVYDSPLLDKLPLLQPPRTVPVPSTPPNSPSRSPCPSPPPFESRVHHSENFLASRPAETFLQEMYGLKPSRNAPEVGQLKMNLVDRLKRLGIARVVKPPDTQDHKKNQGAEISLRRPDSAVFLNAGSNLMAGLRRNQSLPAMIGALGAPVCTQSTKMDILKED